MQGVYCHSTFTTYAGRLTFGKTSKNVHKQTEFSNHLGNVLVTISDVPLGVDSDTDGYVDYYMLDVKTTSDYEPFGAPLVDRTFPNPALCDTIETDSILYALNESFGSGTGGFVSVNSAVLSDTSDKLSVFIDAGSSSTIVRGTSRTFGAQANVEHTLTFVYNVGCGTASGGGHGIPPSYYPNPVTVNIKDDLGNIIATETFGTIGLCTLAFTPSVSGTYTVEFLSSYILDCTFYLDDVKISYPFTYNQIVCQTADSYRFGFNRQVKDDEMYGEGNSYNFEARLYNPRIGRFFSIDPITHEYISPYAFPNNSPIMLADPTGCEGEDPGKGGGGKGVINVSFYPADTRITYNGGGGVDGIGADNNDDKQDDCLVTFQQDNAAANNPTGGLMSIPISSKGEIGTRLAELKAQGYTIGNVLINAHAMGKGGFCLGGAIMINNQADRDQLIAMLKDNISSTTVVVFNSCGLGVGKAPEQNQNSLRLIAEGIGRPVLASMGLGSGEPFKLQLLSSVTDMQKLTEGNRRTLPDNMVLYERCYLLSLPQPVLGAQSAVVANVSVNANGTFQYTNAAETLKYNRLKFEQAKLNGYVGGGAPPIKFPNTNIPTPK